MASLDSVVTVTVKPELLDALRSISDALGKIERNQRLHTKVILGARPLTVPYSQVKDLKNAAEVAEFVRENGGSL